MVIGKDKEEAAVDKSCVFITIDSETEREHGSGSQYMTSLNPHRRGRKDTWDAFT